MTWNRQLFMHCQILNLGQVTNLSKPLKVHEVLDRSSSEEVEPKGWTLQSLFEASEKHCPRKVKCPETQAHRWLVSWTKVMHQMRPSKHSCVKTVCRLDNSAVDTRCSDSLLKNVLSPVIQLEGCIKGVCVSKVPRHSKVANAEWNENQSWMTMDNHSKRLTVHYLSVVHSETPKS